MSQRSGRTATPTRDPYADRAVPAGEGTSDEEMSRQVAGQTSSDRATSAFFEREHGGASTDTEAAKVRGDELKD